MSPSVARLIAGHFFLSHESSGVICCWRKARRIVPAWPSTAGMSLNSARKWIAPSFCSARPKFTRLRVSRSSSGNSRATAWAYRQTWPEVPAQQPTPSQPQNRPLADRWQVEVARIEVFRKVRSRNQYGRVESYQVSCQGCVSSRSSP